MSYIALRFWQLSSSKYGVCLLPKLVVYNFLQETADIIYKLFVIKTSINNFSVQNLIHPLETLNLRTQKINLNF
jgi:hypothetical protein